uniref:Uncharacterized protein n=1 Tax=Mammaliicoccus phage MSShimriz1 TaxID=3230127 RepID=A0AAU8GUE0_9VIRU
MNEELFKDLQEYIERNGEVTTGFSSVVTKSIVVTLLTYDFRLEISYSSDMLGNIIMLSGVSVTDVANQEWIGSLLYDGFRTLKNWYGYKDMKLRDIIEVMLIDHKKSWGISEEELRDERVKDFLYGE